MLISDKGIRMEFDLPNFKKEEIKEIPIANETNVSIPPPITQKKSNMLRNIIITIIFILFILIIINFM